MARRLQENARGGQIIICEATYAAVKEQVDVRAIEPLPLKGRSEPMPAYELLALRPSPASEGEAATAD